MAIFVGTINDMSVRYAQRLRDVPLGSSRRVLREQITLPTAVVFIDEALEDSDDESMQESIGSSSPSDASSDAEVDTSFDYSAEEDRTNTRGEEENDVDQEHEDKEGGIVL